MTRDYQYNFSEIDDSMFDESQRITKAKKTISVLEDFLTETNNLTLLDIGCSSGIMTYEYAKKFKKIIAIDIDKQAINYAKTKKSKINIEYKASPIEELNLKENSIDVITCSHIYEHVPSAENLMVNIYKFLKPGGVCYFAAGNRYKIIEGHYKLPFLSFFPKKISNIYIRTFTKYDEYYENHLSIRNLKKLVSQFYVHDYTLKIIKNPEKFYATDQISHGRIYHFCLNILSKVLYFMIPTYIWILEKPE
tara:strand:+ start:1635 stop:2384 length:750 start_codon:yes stop_codon:yes gene_type:complete